MSDLVSRQAAIDAVDTWERSIAYSADYKSVVEVIKSLPSADRPIEDMNGNIVYDEWIPVTERLPDRSGWYLATTNQKSIGIRWCSTLHGFEIFFDEVVIAWMPLPEPYGGDEE